MNMYSIDVRLWLFAALNLLFLSAICSFFLRSGIFNESSSLLSNDQANSALASAEKRYQENTAARSVLRLSIGKTCARGKAFKGVKRCRFAHNCMLHITPSYPCVRLIHVAEWGEGGKWLCDSPGAIPRSSAVVYSIGSYSQVSFELEMKRLFDVRSYTFDPTLKKGGILKLRALEYITFFEIGLTGEPDLKAALNKLKSEAHISGKAKMMHIDGIMSFLNHTFVDVFKVDCEGCEESFIPYLKTVSSRDKPLFGQIQIEFHRLDEITFNLFDILESLGYRNFHAEPNYFFINKNWECSFIHESIVKPK